jgi:hypothetical protein
MVISVPSGTWTGWSPAPPEVERRPGGVGRRPRPGLVGRPGSRRRRRTPAPAPSVTASSPSSLAKNRAAISIIVSAMSRRAQGSRPARRRSGLTPCAPAGEPPHARADAPPTRSRRRIVAADAPARRAAPRSVARQGRRRSAPAPRHARGPGKSRIAPEQEQRGAATPKAERAQNRLALREKVEERRRPQATRTRTGAKRAARRRGWRSRPMPPRLRRPRCHATSSAPAGLSMDVRPPRGGRSRALQISHGGMVSRASMVVKARPVA